MRRVLAATWLAAVLGMAGPVWAGEGEGEATRRPGVVAAPPLSLESIFDGHTPHDHRLIRLVVTGDVLLARTVNVRIQEHQDPRYPFRRLVGLLRGADLTFINLENPLVEGCPPTRVGMLFCGPPSNVIGLEHAGVDVANLANNHIQNYGRSGLEQTRRTLTEHGILPTGLGAAPILEAKGTRFGFLGYSPLTHPVDGRELERDLRALRRLADVIVVQFHWGVEYTHHPTRQQRALARLAIDLGADLVVGNHPHWVQAVEIHRERLIAYSHGNFVFDQMWSTETRRGVVGVYSFRGPSLLDAHFVPVVIEDHAQPRPATADEAREVLAAMLQASRALLSAP